MKNRILLAALAAAGLMLAPWRAHAEPNVPVTAGDLILGLQLSGDNDLEVDIGPYTTYLNATSAFNVSFGVIPADQTGAGNPVTSLAADLSATFGGSGWPSSGLLWGVAGTGTGNIVNTNFLTQDAVDPDIPQRPSNSSAPDFADGIGSLDGGLGGSPSTANSTETGSVAAGSANAWDTFNPSTSAFGTGLDIENQNPDSSTTSTLDLFELAPNGRNGGGNGTEIGSFTLNSSGDLTFTPVAVPEPSTWLSVIPGALSLVFARRRRGHRAAWKPNYQ